MSDPNLIKAKIDLAKAQKTSKWLDTAFMAYFSFIMAIGIVTVITSPRGYFFGPLAGGALLGIAVSNLQEHLKKRKERRETLEQLTRIQKLMEQDEQFIVEAQKKEIKAKEFAAQLRSRGFTFTPKPPMRAD